MRNTEAEGAIPEGAIPEAATLVAGTLPASTPAGATRAGTSAGCISGSESTLPGMRDSERPLLRIPRPMGRHTCGTSPRRPTCHPLRGFRQRFFGLHRYCYVDPTAKFLSFLPPCAVIAVSSSTAFGGFLPPDAS